MTDNVKMTVPIVFSSDDNYAPYLGVLMCSIIHNSNSNNNYEFIVLETRILDTSKNKLQKLVKKHKNFSLRFIRVSDYVKCDDFHVNTYFSIESYYRLYIPILLKEYKKIIYLDVDTIALTDIAELINIDLKGKTVGATINLSTVDLYNSDFKTWKNTNWRKYFDETLRIKDHKKYIQTGVMVFDIEQMIRNNDHVKLIKIAKSYPHLLVDQDVINSYYNGEVTMIDQSWNLAWLYLHMRDNDIRNKLNDDILYKKLIKAKNNPKIIHYDGEHKPWVCFRNELHSIWWKYAKLSPFYINILIKANFKCIREKLNLKTPNFILKIVQSEIFIKLKTFITHIKNNIKTKKS